MTPAPTTAPRRLAALLVLLTALLVPPAILAGCGLPEDGEPRAIPADELPDPLRPAPTTATTLPPENAETRDIYLVQERQDETQQVIAVPTPVPQPAGYREALEALLKQSDQASTANVTRIPPETELLSTDLNDGVLTVDLSEEMGEVEGPGSALAWAQIVFTVTQFDEVDSVRFKVEGETTSVQLPDAGTSQLVTREQYADLDPQAG